MEFCQGIIGTAEFKVTLSDSALVQGSGSLEVFSTPRLLALMEQAACNAIAPFLDEGTASVGVQVTLNHNAATPIGMQVWAEAKWTALEGRMLSFEIEAFDEGGSIALATHQRCIVQTGRFMQKTQARSASHGNPV